MKDEKEIKTMKDIAIERLLQLPECEVAKVLIFMSGLDAGLTIAPASEIKLAKNKLNEQSGAKEE